MDLSVVPLHQRKEYMNECCSLINNEWKRSQTARMRTLELSSDDLPTSLILLKDVEIIGHLRLTPIPSAPDGCFVESVVIAQALRSQGFGTVLMMKAEDYCRHDLQLKTIYLSTKGQEKFYSKLGYIECPPISIYGSYTPITSTINCVKKENQRNDCAYRAPVPPPLPRPTLNGTKIFMKKNLS